VGQSLPIASYKQRSKVVTAPAVSRVWESDPDAYIYFITQAPVWGAICDLIGKPDGKRECLPVCLDCRILGMVEVLLGEFGTWSST